MKPIARSLYKFIRSSYFPLLGKQRPAPLGAKNGSSKYTRPQDSANGPAPLAQTLDAIGRFEEASRAAAAQLGPEPKSPLSALAKSSASAASVNFSAPGLFAAPNRISLGRRAVNLSFALRYIEVNRMDPQEALALTIKSRNLDAESAIYLEDALARYLLRPDWVAAFDETPNQQVSRDAGLHGQAAYPESKHQVPRGEDSMAKTESSSDVQKAVDLVPLSALPESGARPSAVSFGTSGQFNPKWASLGGETACTFISLAALKLAESSQDGTLSSAELDEALQKGISDRKALFDMTQGRHQMPLDGTPTSAPIINQAGYKGVDLFPEHLLPLPGQPGIHIEGLVPKHLIPEALDILLAMKRPTVLVAGSMTIALTFGTAGITVLDSHGDNEEFPERVGAYYGVTFLDAVQAKQFLVRKMNHFTTVFDDDSQDTALEAYQK